MHHKSHVTCHISCVTCHISTVTYHLSPTPTATVTDTPPANSPTMHSRLVHKDLKSSPPHNIREEEKIFLLANNSNSLFHQKSQAHQKAGFWGGTNIQITNNRRTLRGIGNISLIKLLSEGHTLLEISVRILWKLSISAFKMLIAYNQK